MTAGRRFPRSEILRGYRSFAAVFSQRRFVDSELVRCFYFHERSIPPGSITVGFAVRNSPNAATRNRVRRLMREAYRLNKNPVTEFCHRHQVCLRCVFLADAKRFQPATSFDAVQKSLQDILQALCQKVNS